MSDTNIKFQKRQILLGGTMAGLAQIFAGHPFDTIKVRYISNVNNVNKTKNPTLRSTITTSWKKGFRSFYRGVTSPMIGSVIMNIQTFYVYNYIGKRLNKNNNNNNKYNTFLAGGLTGLTLAVVETPTDLIKTKLQINNLNYINTIKQVGINNLYKGFCITSLRNFTSVGLYFWGYENTLNKFDNKYTGAFAGGAVAGFMCWGLNYPLDNIKTQIQTSLSKSLNTRIILKKVIKTKSYSSLWAGFLPCIVRAVFVNPFVFLGYELGKSII